MKTFLLAAMVAILSDWQMQAPRPERGELSPDGRWLLLWDTLPAIPDATIKRPWHGLAELQIDMQNGTKRRSSIKVNPRIVDVVEKTERPLKLDATQNLQRAVFSPDSQWLAAGVDDEKAGRVLLLHLASGKKRTLSSLRWNDLLSTGIVWAPDSRTVFLRSHKDQGLPIRDPEEPQVRNSSGVKEAARPYAYLLQSDREESRFRFLASGQWHAVSADGSKGKRLDLDGLVTHIRFSPDGRYVLVERLSEPLNRNLPARLMPIDYLLYQRSREEVWTLKEVLKKNQPRSQRKFYWNPSRDHQLMFFEPNLMSWDIRTPPVQVQALDQTATNLLFLSDGSGYLVQTLDLKNRKAWVDYVRPGTKSRRLFTQTIGSEKEQPGKLVSTGDGSAEFVALAREGKLFLKGPQSLEEFDPDTGNRTVIFKQEGREGFLQDVIGFVDQDPTRLVLVQESPDSPPSYLYWDRLRNTWEGLSYGKGPVLTQIESRVLRYQRHDGLQLSATLLLPKSRRGPVPLLYWAYPMEHEQREVTGAPGRYFLPDASSPEWLALHGYAVLFNAPMPLLADYRGSSDEQMEANIAAATEPLITQKIVDPARIAIGGHSFGANMVAQVLTHQSHYCAGLAMNGAYNRTLTPFGFQNEKRNLWEAEADYLRQSPLLRADQLKSPLLLIHGQDDVNPGTPALQSERFFQALLGLGKPARLLIFPEEGHTLRGYEAVRRVRDETIAWLQEHCGPEAETKGHPQTSIYHSRSR